MHKTRAMQAAERQNLRAFAHEQMNTHQQNMQELESETRKKRKEHLEFFFDAVVAIIITVMVLEIPLPLTAEGGSYFEFIKALGIFFISFFIVANFWYGNHKIFSHTQQISQPVLVLNFVFLALLCVIPLLTKWIMADTSQFAVLHYGAAYFLIDVVSTVQLLLLHKDIGKAHPNPLPQNIYKPMLVLRLLASLVQNAILIVLATWNPFVAMALYTGLPFTAFFLQSLPNRRGMHQHPKRTPPPA